MSEYVDTWKATLMLAISSHRGAYAKDLCRIIHCSQTTFRKYAQMLVDCGEVCVMNYGTRLYPDNRYYVVSDATKEFCEPLQTLLTDTDNQIDYLRDVWLGTKYESVENTKAYARYSAYMEMRRDIIRRLDLLQRVAVRIGNT